MALSWHILLVSGPENSPPDDDVAQDRNSRCEVPQGIQASDANSVLHLGAGVAAGGKVLSWVLWGASLQVILQALGQA